ncbi:XXYS1_4_G0029560.mRNA.1.CDS.1 [Saccharomyces cerevisiae]|nr:EM14S01-3B_G0027040.mRNA.1.CDS.1 [Saccharomyces cerevisiae]CAD6647125.1 XXYS1_4_G0029560.mRNA.1.CDS.1 [Saccharomyces cerevisiae]CAI4772557.1 CEI_1a_G0048800.mRNA.1.CDS.1 [Saccharomyces cerevisiae]CAI4778875.1 AMH_1a_G0048910.mRNA.1.CDS.1 [Saccharomyces cerevisiae]CAI6876991.1 AMH_1a_G0048910.mRNA.1.CDS.1 [Saccharomyces cerevisiae]
MAKSVSNFFHFKILEYLNRFVYHSQYFLPYYCSLEVLGKSRKNWTFQYWCLYITTDKKIIKKKDFYHR